MDAILFSANPKIVDVEDAINHLRTNYELYWEVGFKINKRKFHFPIIGYLHICDRNIEYKAEIADIINYSKAHYENEQIAHKLKPYQWRLDWLNNTNNIRNYNWKSEFIITAIMPFKFETKKLIKENGVHVFGGPQGYVRVQQLKEIKV